MPQSKLIVTEMICVWMRFNAKANKCLIILISVLILTGCIIKPDNIFIKLFHMENLYTFSVILVMKK